VLDFLIIRKIKPENWAKVCFSFQWPKNKEKERWQDEMY